LSEIRRIKSAAVVAAIVAAPLFAQTSPSVRIVLPERTRLLQGQLVDLVLEVRNAAGVSNLKVMAGGVDLTSKFGAPARADLDCECAEHVRQLEGESPFHNLMEVK